MAFSISTAHYTIDGNCHITTPHLVTAVSKSAFLAAAWLAPSDVPSRVWTVIPVVSSFLRIRLMLRMAAVATAGNATNLDSVALVLSVTCG
jgi:hypothetical protein